MLGNQQHIVLAQEHPHNQLISTVKTKALKITKYPCFQGLHKDKLSILNNTLV